ncbi:MAG: transposase family protein, partial [Acidobacteria bacterium]|nr:transposase family protein [Acidobacteriota bacterium]
MYHTTGVVRERIVDLCALIHSETMAQGREWPPILGLFKSVVTVLTYLRRNRVQAELAETYAVSQSTISRAITVLTPLLGTVLA